MDKDKKSSSSTSGTGQKRKVDNNNSSGKPSPKKPKQPLLIPYSSVQTLLRHEKAYDYYDEREIDIHFNGKKSYGVSVQNLKENTYYSIERIKKNCKWGSKCELYCKDCDYCRHQFECECGDEYMCDHVHRLCGGTRLSSDDESTSDDSESDSDGEKKSHEEDGEDGEDGEDEEEVKPDKLSALFSECRSLVTDEIGEEILRENMDRALIQLQAHGQKLKK